jgi:peptide/nickel transport system substrate-binding protein
VWSRAAQPAGNPNEIVTRFGLSHAAEIREVEEGRADYSTDSIPMRMLPTLRARFSGQLHPATIPTTAFFALNTRLPPFDDIRVRQALNFAIDRHLLVRLYGGPAQAIPTCQILPPGVLGYRRNCPYTRNPNAAGRWASPNLPEARRLVAASGTRGASIRLVDSTADITAADYYVARVLRRLGYRVSVRLTPLAFSNSHPGMFDHVQLSQVMWGDTPYGYFATWFSCTGQANEGWFCDRRVASENLRAQSLLTANPPAAESVWARIDRHLVARAAWLPLVDLKGVDFVSARVRNYQFDPYSGSDASGGLIADQLWLMK